ncbi:auxilin-like protein 1 isoform X1 [Cynara cardunculus var. scolymus]|uniref:auxilin-like protein 1 isoform X1 n=2 Tax=Cynara cardunculus var. scolymus TaxID=59895 RepID=UPI000D62A9CC|nr:auxilin-like protein 1 isoform X1 [Cynara cardunculus var. scolymus]
MESLSRPFHSRKLSNATSFSPKNAYHGVFSGHRHNYAGTPGIDVQDYREIFATSQVASSIPVLDLSNLGVTADATSLNTRSSKPDYSKIFGGFRDEDVAVSYEELFARDKASPSSIRSTSQDSDDLCHQSSNALKQFNMSYHKISPKSKDGLDGTRHVTQLHAVPGFTCFIDETSLPPKMEAEKHKSSAVDVSVDSSKEGFAKKQPSENAVRRKSKPHPGESFSEDKLLKTFEIGLRSQPSTVLPPSASLTKVDNHKTYSKIPTAINSESCKTNATESADARFSPTYVHEELDINSAAAASAAALRKAIEKAQESIRIAKESVGRKKKGLRSFSSKSATESLKVDGGMEDVTADEEQKCKVEVTGVFERVSASSQAFPDLGRNRKYGGTVVFPDFMDGEKLFVAKKVIDEMNGKISESTKACSIPVQSSNKFKDDMIISNPKQFMGETEFQPLDSAAKDRYVTVSSEAVDTEKSRNDTSGFVHADQTNNISVDDYEGEIKKTKPTAGVLEHQGVVKKPESVERAYELEEVGKQDALSVAQGLEGGEGTLKSASFMHKTCGVRQEDGASAQRPQGFLKIVEADKSRESLENKDEARPSNVNELAKGLANLTVAQKVEDEKKESQVSYQNDDEKRLNEVLGLLENEKQEVLQQEHVENVENEEMHRKKNNEASDKGLEEASQCLESENESKDDIKTESHKEEETREMFYDVCELEMKDSAQTCVTSIEEIEMTLQDDCEMKQEDNHTGEKKRDSLDEACDHEFDENSSGDDNPTVETDNVDDTLESCKVDMNDNNVETTQDVDDVGSSPVHVTGASCEFQIEDTEAIQGADELEGEFFEKTSSDQTISDDNEDECEVKYDNLADLDSADTALGQNETEESDVRSESSSGTVRGVEEEADESNKEKNTIDEEKIVPREEKESNIRLPHKEMPEVGSINEMKASEEPRVSNETEKTMDVNEETTTRSQYKEKEDKIGETGPKKVAGKEHRRKWHEIDEVTAREREREKNRLAVDRAIREARERAFAETRERAERAAVEKATEEVRQRMMADAREKAAKASVVTKSSSERIAQSKLRAERAAVERATSEARQRALEKAISQKSVSEAGPLQDLHSSNETSTESAQRSKAKLEKHNRIMERVATALAEKEKRDLLAQKEQAERNRLAENLNANIKRWSSGKEGNLRALLSTLQYILGPDSGWQAVSLTEIVSSSAVKKAYRKATLCVHPDKLQQRGASVQHKYICEKVFDLLKEAWNRFNAEER